MANSSTDTSLAPADGSQDNIGTMANANVYINDYIASITNLPTSLPLSNGEDLLVLLNLSTGIATANNDCNYYENGVSPNLRVLRDTNFPDCNNAFSGFAQACASVPELQGGQSQPLSAGSCNIIFPYLQAFSTAMDAMQTNVTSMRSSYTLFYNSLNADHQTLASLLGIFDPNDPLKLSSSLNLSASDIALAQTEINNCAPTLKQDVGLSLQQAALMQNSLSSLGDIFANLSLKVNSLAQTLQKAESQTALPFLETISINNSLQKWQQLTAYIGGCGF